MSVSKLFCKQLTQIIVCKNNELTCDIFIDERGDGFTCVPDNILTKLLFV